MTDALSLCEDRAHRRRERWTTIETVDLPEPNELGEPTIVTRYSRCAMESRRRFIRSDVLVSVNGCFEPPSSVARDFLMIRYRHGPKWTADQRAAVLNEISTQPLFVKPCSFEEGFYIDLRAAYWSIMLRVGWDVNYWPGVWLSVQDPPADFPWQYDKRARNSLVSIGRSTTIPVWRPETGYRLEFRPNPRPNSQLFCLIMDVLNGIASEVVDAGAVYVFADGYIAPSWEVAQRIRRIIGEWGFRYRIKGQGRGWTSNLGSYRVGAYHSKGYLQAAEHNSIKRLSYHSWLKSRMQWATTSAPWHDYFAWQDYPRDKLSN